MEPIEIPDEAQDEPADEILKEELDSLISPAFAERALLERGYFSCRPRISHGGGAR